MIIDVQNELPQLRLGLLQLKGQYEKAEADLKALGEQIARQEGIILYVMAKAEQQQKQAPQPVVETQP